jgi:hypothetical protein
METPKTREIADRFSHPLETFFGFSIFSAVRKGGPLTEVNMTLTPSELLMWGALFSPVLAVAALFLNDDGGHPA